jgi:hypothetical protein
LITSNKFQSKTIWLVTGNKGGVGKSLTCLALASALEIRREPYAILDGDGRTNDVYNTFLRKCPALTADFRKLQPDSPVDPHDATYEEQVNQLLKSSPNLIINTPDGADDILMKWFDVTLKHTEHLNVTFKMIFLMSDRPDGLKILPDMMKRFHFLYPFKNLFFGDPSLFHDFDDLYARKFRKVIHLNKLRQSEIRLMRTKRTYPTEAIRLKNEQNLLIVPTLSRARIMNWMLEFFVENEKDLFDNKSIPNVLGAQ